MFSGCSNITSAKINTMYLGYQMFYSCNKLTDITIGNNVQKIGVDAFQATNPYSETNLLSTSLSSNNLLATFYDWASDNRTLRVETVSLTEKITGIENTTYHEDLKEALAATSDKEILDEGTQSVIKLYAAQSGDVVIGENKNIKLDLNGNSISTGKTVESIPVGGVDDVCITNNGTLEIIDETGEGEVAITTEDTVGGEVRTSAVLNNGTFKLTSGRLRNTSTTSYSTNSGALVNNGNATINDGTLETTGVLNAVNVQEGTVTFGKNDGLVGTSTPTIISETTAIVNEGGSFEFYDGNITEELEGQSDESINEIAYNTTILKTDNGNNTRTLTLDFDTTAFITEWTIPVDADEVSGDSIVNESGDTIISGPATTIKLPIPANTANMFVVDWGDGSEVESFDGAANFPTHTYNNTEKKVYTIKINGTVKNIGYVGGMFGSPTMTNEYKDYYTFTTYLTGLKQWGELSAETYGFSFCSKLSSTIPEPTTNSFKNVISMKALFRSCPKLTGTIPENLFKNAENITSFEYAFSYCNGLTGNIPAGLFSDTTKVLSFEGIFFNCKNLTGNIPSDLFVNTTQVTTFKEAFAYCYNLTGSIPEELFAKTENVTTFEHTFFASKKLSGSIPNNLFTNTSKVISFSGTFGGCENLIGNIPEELFKNTKKVQTFNGVFWNCSGLTGSIPIDLFVNTSEVQSFNQTFEGCIGLTGSIPASLFVNTTQVTTFNNTFYGCIGLSGSIPEELFTYTPSVTTFNSTFQNCTGLSGNIPAKLFEKTSQVTNFMYTFCGCTGLTGDIPAELFETNTAITTIPESMNYGGFYGTFNGCSNLTSASINTIYVGSQMFYGCNKITNITIGDNVQAIGTDAFEATEPYNATNLLTTGLRGVNSVATNYDWTSDNRTVIDGYALITEWTIPVDINGIGLGTTILLPIPKHNNNAYTVNWGDGSSVETFDSTADFPSHTYMNTVETVYTIQIKGSVNVFGYVGTYHPSQTNVGKNYCTFVDYLTGLKQWGELNATRYSFYWCENLTGSIPSPTENTFSRVTNMQDLFGYCETLIGPIPEDLFKSAKNVTSFNGAFQDCHDLTGSIPENLFANTTKVTDFSYTFFNCFELTGSIPEKLFWNTPKVTTFTDLFYQCTKLTGNIPKYLFVNNLEATKFDSVFKVCKGLTGGIPAELFEKNTKAIDFSATFMSCEGLTGNIPEKLFANNTKATDFSSTFRSCPNLTGEISEKLFENNLEVTTFFATFDGCKSLTGNIPSNLFANNTKVTTFRDTFSSCSSLTGSIPVELFKNNLNVTTFASTFYGCSSLTESIPENLFINNINVTTFGSTFYGCSSLTNSIPEDLFVNNIKVTTFSHTFYECSSLSGSIPEDLFKTVVTAKWFSNTFGNCINLSNNIPENLFESNVNTLSFNNTFSGCSNLKGNIPEKLFVNTTKVTDFTGTFNGCSGLIGTIPAILFEKTPNVEYFNSTFSGCSGLSGEIPATLFANTPSVYGFRETFANCTGLTGSIPIELFASNTVITDLPSTEEECFTKTFYNCSGLTSVNINTLYIGADMFYGCNNLTDITIGDKVKLINGTDAFQATDPYSATNPLLTNLTTDNIVPLAYDWAGDNRKDGTFIVKEPEDIKVKEFTEANFNVEVSGNNLSYQWYEVVSGEAIALTDKNVKIYKSNIEGQEGATATNTIIIKTDKTKLLSFEYMVSSEQEKDTFTVTIEDGNGIITAVDGISGEVDWTRYEKEIVPNENGEVILTLTYSKNNSVDIGGDFGAIRNLNCYEKIDVTSNFENDRFFTITTPDTDLMISNDWQNTPFSIVEEEGELVFKNHNNGIYHSYGSAKIEINLQEEAILTFDVMTVKSSYVEWAHVMIEDKDSSKMTTSLWEWNTYTETVEPNIHGKVTVNLLYEEILGQAQYESFIAIRNLNIKTGWNYLSSFVDDDMYMFSGNDWIISGYTGYKDSNLTIPAEMVNTTLDGNQYYCEISSPFGTYTTRQALLTVEEVIDPNEIFITEWKIPVDMDGVASSTGTPGTTIKLPIPSNSLNNYRVDWGDGTIEKFDGTANFPTHTYNNTTETVYEIKINGKVDSFGYYKETAPTLTDSSTIDYYTFTQYLTGIKQWGAIGLTRVGFANCINLVSSIPEPIIGTFENVTSMERVFYACSNLSGTIPTNFFESATETLSFKDAFNGCKALTGNIPENLFKTNTKATSFANTFAECTLLEGSIPSNLFSTNAEVTDFTSTFENCSKLSGEIPSSLFTTTTKVTSFANTFKGCMNLSGTIPQNLFIKNKEALDFSNTFNGCSKLSGMVPLRLFAFNDKATNFTSTFEGCSSITAADIQINTENVTSMDGMFKNCTKLESVVFEKEFKNLTGAGMFENCSALRAVILLNQATTEAEVGIANDLTTLGMPSGTIIYVPYKENEPVYESVWSNIPAERIERIVQILPPNPDTIGLGETYVDPGYTVAGFAMDGDEAIKWQQYGFRVQVNGMPVDTSTEGSKWIKYILYK